MTKPARHSQKHKQAYYIDKQSVAKTSKYADIFAHGIIILK